jgi:N-acetylglucosamine-6-phosphate deacetylase
VTGPCQTTAAFLAGARLAIGGEAVAGQGVLVRDGRIEAVLPDRPPYPAPRLALPEGSVLGPALIDLQVNGGGGVLFNDRPDVAGGRAIAAAHRALGTGFVLPTLISDTHDAMARAAEAAIALCAEADSGVVGVHFEGPFLSPARPGVHRPDLLRAPTEADLALIEDVARRVPVMVTLAPEVVPDAALRRLAASGAVLCAGHSEASAARLAEAAALGVRGATHLFNAMPPIAARAPGLAAAALAEPSIAVGLIADGYHVDPVLLRLVRAAVPVTRRLLVSDAMACAGTADQAFMLQGRAIRREGGRLVTGDGTLAGADLDLSEAVRRAVALMGASVAEAIAMASTTPAALLGVRELGRIEAGARAEFVVCDETGRNTFFFEKKNQKTFEC